MTDDFSELALSGEHFDRLLEPMHAKIIICSTQRTGSFLLCRAMNYAGLGVPHEYFNNFHVAMMGPRFGLSKLQDGHALGRDPDARKAYIAALIKRRTANGIFAAKIQWWEFERYLDNPEGVELFHDAHFVHLYREDLLAQAVSFHVSMETGRWGNDDTITTVPNSNPNFFDVQSIDRRLDDIAEGDMNWRLFFARNNITPLAISFERLRDNLADALRLIVDTFDLKVPGISFQFEENGPSETRDRAVPPRSEIRNHFLRSRQRVTPTRQTERKQEILKGISMEQANSGAGAKSPRYAVVTAYYKEPREILERCIRSVREQTVAADHFLVADGFPQDWVDDIRVRHIKLDRSHGNYGDTPRAMGSMIAVAEGYDAICFLDADCWLEPDHIEYCLQVAATAGPDGCEFVVALRHERRPDGTIMDVGQVPVARHVDTNCYFFLKSGFHILPVWGMIPREVSVVGDRVFYLAVKTNQLRAAVATRRTVNYTCLWASIYRAMGEEPPEGAKPNPDHRGVMNWIANLSEQDRAVIERRIRARLADVYASPESTPPLSIAPVLAPAAAPPPIANNIKKSGAQKICLSMIAKNEAPVIARCLASVRPLIDYWIIVDTGSTDGTQTIIRETLRDLPGELHERPWVDFAHNRTEALDLAKPHGDYTLIIDADDVLELPRDFKLPALTADSYTVEIRNKDRRYWRPQLIRNALPWRYVGVLHEFLSCPEDRSQGQLSDVRIVMSEEGARRRVAASDRFQRDAAILEAALKTETDPFLVARYNFYLAQSRLDAGDKARALALYLERAKLGFWNQEVFISLYRAANVKAELGHDADEIIQTYLRAHAVAGNRAEALHGAARFCRTHGRFQEGFEFAERALKISPPIGGLFLEQWIYDYGSLDEYAVNAYWLGRYEDCAKACRRILSGKAIPAAQRTRIQANLDFALAKLSETQKS